MTDTEQTEPSTQEQITLHGPGSIPGIPGEHGPGAYVIDWATRTIRPLVAPVPEPPAEAQQADLPAPPTQAIAPPAQPEPESAPTTLADIATEVTQIEEQLQHIEQSA